MSQPNILLIFTDQQRFDTIAALGNPVIKTPNLDRLCREGVAFTSAYTPCPVCVPARCSMHYGKYPGNTGCMENQYPMRDDLVSFMDVLTGAGYRTHGIGKCHFMPDSKALRGFQTREMQEEVQSRNADDYMRFVTESGYEHVQEPHGVRGEMYYVPQVSMMSAQTHPTNWVGDRSVAFIEKQSAREEPWMLFSSYIHPHPPFAPPSPWYKLYRAGLMPLPKMPDDYESLHAFINRHQNRYKYRDQGRDLNLLRCMKAHYYACISFIDYQVGKMLDALDTTGQLDNTLILFTSDHGEHLGDYNCFGKRSMHDSCARIPLIVRQPGRFEGGQTCEQPVSLVDVAPTLLTAALGGTGEMQSDGVDLKTIVDGHERNQVHIHYDRAGKAIYTTITPRWKYAYSAADDREFLFDRVQDPGETRNRAGHAFLRNDLENLRAATIKWLKRFGETEGIEGDSWRKYPRLDVDSDPDTGLLIQDVRGFEMDLPDYTEA